MGQELQTVEKILQVAEEHFATQGFFASSLRQITMEAGVNVAAVHYHFGSKEKLFLEVLNRQIAPFVTDFMAELKRVEASKKTIYAEDLVEGYVTIISRMVEKDEKNAYLVSSLVARLTTDEYKIFRQDLAERYEDMSRNLLELFRKALPFLDKETVRWRMHFAISTLFNAFAGKDVLNALMPNSETYNPKDIQLVRKYVVPFVVQGLKA